MNKIILIGLSLAVAAVSSQASVYSELCNDNSEESLRAAFNQNVYIKNRFIMDGTVNKTDKSDADEYLLMIKGRAHYESLQKIQKTNGVSTSYSFTTDSGQNLNIESSQVAIALDKYVRYLYTNYSQNSGMLTKHYVFMSKMTHAKRLRRLTDGSDFNNYQKVGINGAWLVDTDTLDYVLNGTRAIYEMTCKNNYNSTSVVGHMGADTQEYLLMIVQSDYAAADAFLNDLIPSSEYKDYMKNGCRIYKAMFK